MTREQDIRAEVLFQLYAVRPLEQSAALMARQARKVGMDFREAEIDREAIFLVDQGMISESRNPVTAEKRYRILSRGIIEYEAK